MGVFPAQLPAIISLFLWNLLLEAEPKKPPLWETKWVSQKVDRCGEGAERGVEYPSLRVTQSPDPRAGRSESLLLALLLCD